MPSFTGGGTKDMSKEDRDRECGGGTKDMSKEDRDRECPRDGWGCVVATPPYFNVR